MYFEIENEFKRNSTIRTSQLLLVLGSMLLSSICTFITELLANEENYANIYMCVLLVGLVFFYIICYCYMFFKGIKKQQRTLKTFFQIKKTIQAYKSTIHNIDINLLNKILKSHEINTRPKVEEAIRHYQCLLPRKINQSGQLTSLLALVISFLALLSSETILNSLESARFILGVLLTVVIMYLFVKWIDDSVFRAFSRNALYARIEESLSEIFMSYYIKKDNNVTKKD